MKTLYDLSVKIFADGGDKKGMLDLYSKAYISGFTTNPSLLHKAGVTDYKGFAMDMLGLIKDKPIMFEVLSDDFNEMKRQAFEIASWAKNVYVKIPVCNSLGIPSYDLIKDLARENITLTITTIMTSRQIREVSQALGDHQGVLAVFAGRIADTGVDPVPMLAEGVEVIKPFPRQELLWASPREILNIFQADSIGCQIITVAHDILNKMNTIGKDLTELSVDAVKTFKLDSEKAGLALSI